VTTLRKLRLIANAGDPDDILVLRISVVEAAMRVLKAYDHRKGVNDFVWSDNVDNAVSRLVTVTRRYKAAVRRRERL
jgi:hypothetical protein